jgi:hypothetical protein
MQESTLRTYCCQFSTEYAAISGRDWATIEQPHQTTKQNQSTLHGSQWWRAEVHLCDLGLSGVLCREVTICP